MIQEDWMNISHCRLETWKVIWAVTFKIENKIAKNANLKFLEEVDNTGKSTNKLNSELESLKLFFLALLSHYCKLIHISMNLRWFNTILSEWNWSFIILSKKYFAFFTAPASHVLLGERQTYRGENDIPKAL